MIKTGKLGGAVCAKINMTRKLSFKNTAGWTVPQKASPVQEQWHVFRLAAACFFRKTCTRLRLRLRLALRLCCKKRRCLRYGGRPFGADAGTRPQGKRRRQYKLSPYGDRGCFFSGRLFRYRYQLSGTALCSFFSGYLCEGISLFDGRRRFRFFCRASCFYRAGTAGTGAMTPPALSGIGLLTIIFRRAGGMRGFLANP